MGLPLTRDLTAAAGDPVPSAAFNNLQDCVIDLDLGKHDTIFKTVFPIGTPMLEPGGTWVPDTVGTRYQTSSATGTALAMYREIPLPAGERITRVELIGANASAAAGSGVMITIVKQDLATPAAALTSMSAQAHLTGITYDSGVNPTTPAAIATTEAWYLKIESEVTGATLRQVVAMRVWHDHP